MPLSHMLAPVAAGVVAHCTGRLHRTHPRRALRGGLADVGLRDYSWELADLGFRGAGQRPFMSKPSPGRSAQLAIVVQLSRGPDSAPRLRLQVEAGLLAASWRRGSSAVRPVMRTGTRAGGLSAQQPVGARVPQQATPDHGPAAATAPRCAAAPVLDGVGF
jgi:hypothetical protein